MTENLPNSFRIQDGYLLNNIHDERYRISNRNVDEVDHYFRGFLLDSIDYLRQQSSDSLKVLDLGGGKTSQAAKDIAKRFPRNVFTVNADLLAQPVSDPQNVLAVNASIFNLPFRDNSFHLVYSRHLLASMNKDSRGKRTSLAVTEAVRVLKKGGIGIIDEHYFSHYPMHSTGINQLSKKLDVTVEAREGGLFECSLESAIERGKNGHFRTRKFLIIFKSPVNNELKNKLADIPYKTPRKKIYAPQNDVRS